MPNTYDAPGPDRSGQKSGAGGPRKTVGVYERPRRKGPSRLVLLILILAALAVAVLLARRAWAGPEAAAPRVAWVSGDFCAKKLVSDGLFRLPRGGG